MIFANGITKKIAVIRLDPGEDVLDSIVEYCRSHQIRNGVISAMHGSLSRAEYCTVSRVPELSTKYGYTAPIVYDDICELLNASGTVTHEEDGTINVHIHCCFGDSDGNVFGGHMVSGNKVLLVTEIAVNIIEDADMLGVRCETGGILFTPRDI